MRKQPVLYSFAIHLGILGALLVVATFSHYSTNSYHSVTLLEPVRRQKLTAPRMQTARVETDAGSEGGGHKMVLPVVRGEVPKVVQKVFLAPVPRPRETPQIALPTGLEDMPQIADATPIGLPTGVLGTRSLGPGVGKTVGDGKGNRVGPGEGRGPGDEPGIGGGSPPARLSVLPQVLWKIEPEYSEEARKVRHQGSVMLALEVGSDGRPKNIRVVRSLGLGLDERAIEAVSQWRFKPGIRNGRPVSSPVSVEVSFRLL